MKRRPSFMKCIRASTYIALVCAMIKKQEYPSYTPSGPLKKLISIYSSISFSTILLTQNAN